MAWCFLTGWQLLDPALAVIVGLLVLWSGWELVKESIGGLMDEAASADVLAKIREQISQHGEGALEAHDLRTRIAGRSTFIDFHLVVPGDMSVDTAHDICDRIETAIKEERSGCPHNHSRRTGTQGQAFGYRGRMTRHGEAAQAERSWKRL